MMRTLLRRALAIAALAIASTVGALAPTTVAHAAPSRAVIVIGNSTYTISFSGSVSGLQALQMVASVETVSYGGSLGAAVCKINGVGNAPTSSTCLTGPGGAYWRYFRAAPGASGWSYSSQGASGTTVTDGWVEGWYYGASGSPPFHSFCDTAGCGPPAPVTTAATAPPAGGPAPGSGAVPGGATTGSTRPDGTVPPSSTTTTTAASKSSDDSGEQASASGAKGGRPDIQAGDGDGSPTGVLIAGGVVVALGGTGLLIRRRRAVS
jgi:hypothetical protein